MPFLRFTRDARGYENTFLLHTDRPGESPRVLYWYRSAPAVRVGRPALDEDAIRTIEEQHPEIEFDWPHILEVGSATEPEVEAKPVRRPRPRPPQEPAAAPAAAAESPAAAPEEEPQEPEAPMHSEAPVRSRAHDLLEELVGREIATRLHARYAEIITRVHQLPPHVNRDAWQARAERLNPDNWITPSEILDGVRHADEVFDTLRRELIALL